VTKIYFDEAVARGYDAGSPEMFDPALLEPTVRFLTACAGGGAALEFAIGTGRVALPLQEAGVRVHGIDISRAMVEELRKKPGGDTIDVTIGDIATARVTGRFSLVYLVYNTIMNLTTQDEQVACFCNAAAHLEPGGCFVIEVMVPDLQRLPPGEVVRPFHVSEQRLGFDEYDVATQRLVSYHYRVDDGRAETFSQPFRYVWPAELDLMARIAGLRLRERWSDWNRTPFTNDSRTHVSVWEKPTPSSCQ
jgi:SAM-dependent methyltransferase